MHYTNINIQCSVFLLLALGGWHPAQGKQRISQAKCQEYREANRNICSYSQTARILDGSLYPGDYPFHAVFGFERVDQPSSADDSPYLFLSSAALISDRYVLTAAHSTRYQLNEPVVVRLGATDLRDNDHADYDIEEVIRHPNYTARLAYHDIALVRLKEPVRFSRSIRPACLWDSTEMNFSSVEVTGFGLAEFLDHEGNSARLQQIDLNVLEQHTCKVSFGRTRRFRNGIMDHQLCVAVADHYPRDSCVGDSGSPAIVTTDLDGCAAVYVVGLGSYGATCGAGGPEIYTRVASFVDWIESVVWT